MRQCLFIVSLVALTALTLSASAQGVSLASASQRLVGQEVNGAICRSVAVRGPMVHAWVDLEGTTLTEDEAEELHRSLLETGLQAADDFVGLNLLVRPAGSSEWVTLDAVVDSVPIPSENEDWFEPEGPGPQPSPDYRQMSLAITGQGPRGTSGSPQGALSGRTVFLSPGHGWFWDSALTTPRWRLQRGIYLGMNEDHGNYDQAQFIAQHCFNAGATVVCMRPMGHQPNEVVLDNNDPAVTWSGAWNDSSNSNYYGPDSPAIPYRYISATPTETATATYTPNFPQAGEYPVYCWANYGSDRISGQLYRIRHLGGETEIRINHRRVGRGWVWLGNYQFAAGSDAAKGAVVISNQAPPSGTTTGVVIADTIRFGNGPGDTNYGGGVSGYLRETEASWHWVDAMLGTGPSSIFSLGRVGAPSRMAAEMRRDDGQGLSGDVYLGIHSNAAGCSPIPCGARGSIGLVTDSSGGATPNQIDLASLISDEIDSDCFSEDTNWEHIWGDRSRSYGVGSYGEIGVDKFGGANPEFDATIIEVAFHDNTEDAELLRDPRVRDTVGRACYQAFVRYFNQFDGNPLIFSPEPPIRVRAKADGPGQITVQWAAGPAGAPGGDAATGYRVYRSADGVAFDAGIAVAGTSHTFNGLTAGDVLYLRVAATNAGGESMPSETVVASVGSSNVLIVNGYDRIDRFNNATEDLPPNPGIERVRPGFNNSYSYVSAYAEPLRALGHGFDSCANEAIESGDVNLGAYSAVFWILGEESTEDETFSATEQSAVTTYLNGGGNLFVSGSEIAWDLDSQNNGKTFFENTLRTDYVADDADSHSAEGEVGSLFDGIAVMFSDGSGAMYDVDFPDVLSPLSGATSLLTYGGGGNLGTLLDGFETIGGWRDPNFSGQTTADDACTFAIVNSPVQAGVGAGELHYVWGAGSYIREYSSPRATLSTNSTFTIWVHGDGSGHEVRIALRDTDNDIFTSDPLVIDFTGWQQLVWSDIANNPGDVWYAGGDSNLTGPDLEFDSIHVTKITAVDSGEIRFDEARSIPTGVGGPGSNVAGTVHDGSNRTIVLGFPLETITSASVRQEIIGRAMDFFLGGSEPSPSGMLIH